MLSSGWEFRDEEPSQAAPWLEACVPGHVHLDLQRHGLIPDPCRGLGALGSAGVEGRNWAYRLQLPLRLDLHLPRRVLRFEGLDTLATVVLNGKQIAEHDNMFVPLEVDVSDDLRDGDNVVEIIFKNPLPGAEQRKAQFFEAERLPSSVVIRAQNFVRKAAYSWGWDWRPSLPSAGIWRPVTLIEHCGRITDVHVMQEHRGDGTVVLRAHSEREGACRIVHLFDGRLFDDGTEIELPRAELWHPQGLGPATLHGLTSYLVPEGAEVSPDSVARLALDSREVRVGLRHVRLVREADSDGESFGLEVNGRALWVCGANWVPARLLPGAVTREQLAVTLTKARAAGINLLRVWGGGVYESDEFYDLCDELGILVWQDFAFACGYYPDTGVWQEVVEREAEANVRRLRNHPSLCLWCGNNENQQMHAEKWGGAELHPSRFVGEHLFESVIPRLLERLDPSRPYVPSSPYGGESPNQPGTGDRHGWDVWFGRGDWRFYAESRARFSSEYGFPASPSMAQWRDIYGAEVDLEAVTLFDRVQRFHDRTPGGVEKLRELVEQHYPASTTLADFSYYSQLNQRDAIRHAIEHYRSGSLCRGSIIWQLEDCWPAQSWALLDFRGEWKAAGYELSRLHAPGLLSLSVSGDSCRSILALDNTASAEDQLAGEASLVAYSTSTGEELQRFSAGVAHVRSGERRLLIDASLAALPLAGTLLIARFGELRAWRLCAEPKDVQVGPALPVSFRSEDGYLELVSRGLAVDLLLEDEDGPGAFDRNFLCLLPDERARIAYRGRGQRLQARSLAGWHPLTPMLTADS